jgi:quercetin dioxygenase-like cupin family protein
MAAQLTPSNGPAPARSDVEGRFRDEGLSPHGWGNGPGDRYGAHAHGYHKVLYCLTGSIVFHTADGDLDLGPGDRLDIEPGTEHSATVGPEGVECLEAAR